MRVYVSEAELEAWVRRIVDQIKRQYAEWEDPEQLCHHLGLRIHTAPLGDEWEGAAINDVVILNGDGRRRARQHFTYYHEIVHHLIRRDDALYSILHDQYAGDDQFCRIIERLCNLGASEFLVPRQLIREAAARSRFSLDLLGELMESTPASPTAICVALATHAPHRCIGIVCRMGTMEDAGELLLPDAAAPRAVLRVEVAARSATMRYAVARGTGIPHEHLLFQALSSPEGDVLRGVATIPFSSGHLWEVDCEAMRLGQQVFALFHVDAPPSRSSGQLALPF